MSSATPHQDEQEVAAPSKNVVLAKEEDLEGKMSMLFVGYVYSKGSVSSKGEVQRNTFHTYLQLGPKQGPGKLRKTSLSS